MRLDKYLSGALCISRSDAHSLIKQKRVLVNSKALSKEFDVKVGADLVTFDGKTIICKEHYYYMLNKPSGYVCSTDSRDGTPVANIIKERNDLFPIGRLDKDTEGLLILTNDGDLAHHLTSPKHDITKTYYVKLEKEIENNYIDRLQEGVIIKVDGNDYKCLPAGIEISSPKECYLTIKEGKFHQVKEMFKSLNNCVTYLKRVKVGYLSLDPKLNIGEYKELTEEEVKILKAVK